MTRQQRIASVWLFLTFFCLSHAGAQTVSECTQSLTTDFVTLNGRSPGFFEARTITARCEEACSSEIASLCRAETIAIWCNDLKYNMDGVCQSCCNACNMVMHEQFQLIYGRSPSDVERISFIGVAICENRFACKVNLVSCPVGQYSVQSCEQLTWYMTSRCQTCPAGKYRNSIANQRSCVACKVCLPTQIEALACTPLQDRICTCASGKYFDSSTQQCRDCTVCTSPGQYLETQCKAQLDTVCRSCPEGARTLQNNQDFCPACIDGYFSVNNACRPCTADNTGCGWNQYINCVGGTRTCPVCDGHTGGTPCASGRGVARRCDGSSLGNPTCQNCGPGLERPDGTPLVDGVYQACVKCGTGKYKDVTGTGNCMDCTNKPVNSVYRAWGINELASTSNCPW